MRVLFVAVGLLLMVAVAIGWSRLQSVIAEDLVGIDLRIIHVFVDRWSDTGSMYLPSQLTGPYAAREFDPRLTTLPALYPPNAILLFLPLSVLPSLLWWLIPLSVISSVVWMLRPDRWTWPILAAALAWPNTLTSIFVGNTAMWITAGVASGLLLGWPAALVLLKPSFAPFALVGLARRRRALVIGVAILGVVSLITVGQWAAYLAAVRNSDVDAFYSIGDLPLITAPIIAWLGRRRFRT